MLIEKYQTPAGYSLIKSNTYAHSIEYINKLISIAKADYPELTDDQIAIHVYNNECWQGQTGIEFKVSVLNKDYKKIERLPYTHN